MGIDARTQGERGDKICELLDPKSLVPRLLSSIATEHSVCLRFVDPYGDTYFNQLQLPMLLRELEAAVRACRDPEVLAHGEKLLALAASAVDEVHTYVRFIGD
jgi:hypothetical protein